MENTEKKKNTNVWGKNYLSSNQEKKLKTDSSFPYNLEMKNDNSSFFKWKRHSYTLLVGVETIFFKSLFEEQFGNINIHTHLIKR